MSRSVLTKAFRLSNINPRKSSLRIVCLKGPAAANKRSINSETISKVTAKEKELTGSDEPVPGGPTAQAQKHAGDRVNRKVVSDITKGEKKVTGRETLVKGGPGAYAQSIATSVRNFIFFRI